MCEELQKALSQKIDEWNKDLDKMNKELDEWNDVDYEDQDDHDIDNLAGHIERLESVLLSLRELVAKNHIFEGRKSK
ncbi:MAG: hypothetical protein K0S93_53 [Nitrososphaeraceae archaeon]|jgi:hypothetical protein|nr:hypothetical protein [Nitrososphaeraceae archaeon]